MWTNEVKTHSTASWELPYLYYKLKNNLKKLILQTESTKPKAKLPKQNDITKI